MRRWLPLLAVALAGCGGSPGDLLSIQVEGGPAQRDQSIVVQNDGRSSCNGGPEQDIGSEALIEARRIERELGDDAERAAVYESTSADATSYVARIKEGTVRWDDRARGLPPVLTQAQLFALQQGRALC
jgi:hypothetical protein